MADPNVSLQNLLGKSWELYAESLGYDKFSDFGDLAEGSRNQRRTSCSTLLKKEDRHLYGLRPGEEDFYLVVCELCLKPVKPQAMLRHVEIHHGGANEAYFKELDTRRERRLSQKPKSGKSKNAIKLERRMDVSETYRDLMQQPAVNSNSFSNHVATEYKTFTDQDCNSNSQSSLDSKSFVDMNFLCMKPELEPMMKEPAKGNATEEFANHVQQSHRAPSMQVEVQPSYQPSPSPSSIHQITHNQNQMGSSVVQGIASPLMNMSPLTQSIGPATPGMGRPTTPSMGRPPTPGMGRPLTPSLGNPPTPNMGPPTPIMAPLTPGMGPPTPGMTPHTPGSQNIGMCSMVPAQSPNMVHQAQSPVPSVSPYAQTPSPAQNSNNFQVTSNHQFNQLLQSQSQKMPQTPAMVPQSVDVSPQNGVYSINVSRTHSVQNPQVLRNTSQSMRERESRPLTRQDEEEVQKIREMLIKETEGMMTSNMNEVLGSGIGNSQQMEVQNVTKANMNHPNNSYLNANLSVQPRQPLAAVPQASTVPVPMNPVLAAQIQQIQDELLETVSESDLNAVLNSTPDAGLPASELSGNVSQVKFSDNVAPSHRTTQSLYDNSAMNVQGALDDIFLTGGSIQKAQLTHKSFISADSNTTDSSLVFNLDKSSDNDELTQAVNSITRIYPTDGNFQQSQPLVTNTSVTSFQQPGIQNSHTRPNSNQGVTVVFADPNTNSQMITPNSRRISMPASSPAQQLQENSNTLVQRNLSSDAIRNEVNSFPSNVLRGAIESDKSNLTSQNPTKPPHMQVSPQIQMNSQQKFNQSSPATQSFSNSSTPVTSVPAPSVSPKRPNKRRKSERKFVPLKDREYDPEIHCGVVDAETGTACTRSLTCKTHTLTMRRNVQGRSKKFDELLNQHKASKGAPQRSNSKTEHNTSGLYPNTQVRTPSGGSYSAIGSQTMSQYSTTAPILVRTLSGNSAAQCVTLPDPSPTAHVQYGGDLISSNTSWSQLGHSSSNQITEDYLGSDQSKPIAVCRYSSRRFGGQIRTDHKADLVRNTFRNCLKRPSLGSLLSDNSPPSSTLTYNSLNSERCNVKPLLARKLQGTVQSSANTKELIGTAVGYNGHIQLSNNSIGVNNSSLAAALKRPQTMDLLKNSVKQKSKRGKVSDGAINYVGNVVQLDPTSNKGQFPVVALPNGMTNQQTIAIGNVVATNVRNSSNQSIRLHPQLVKDTQSVDNRGTLGENIVIGSNLSSAGFLLSDSSLKSLKQDGTSGLRIEASKIITTSKGVSSNNTAGPSINLVASTTTVAGATSTVLTQALPHQGQYILTTVPGSANTQILQQLRNCRMGRPSGVKLLGTNAGTVAAGRQAFVLQQEKEAS